VVHFEKFVIRQTNMERGKLPSSRTKISEWKPFWSMKMLESSFYGTVSVGVKYDTDIFLGFKIFVVKKCSV